MTPTGPRWVHNSGTAAISWPQIGLAAVPAFFVLGVELFLRGDALGWQAGWIVFAFMFSLLAISLIAVRERMIADQRRLTAIVQAETILDWLIGDGDALQNHEGYRLVVAARGEYTSALSAAVSTTPEDREKIDAFWRAIDRWRAVVGAKLNAHPFRLRTGDTVLEKTGDLFSDVLRSLRRIRNEVRTNPTQWLFDGE